MKRTPTPPGHLKTNFVDLRQTDESRAKISRKTKQRYAFEKLKPVTLKWGKPK